MTERYPTDANLLAMDQDADTGVPYIATGQSPYYLQFRQMLHRLLLATKRVSDLRVYPDGDLSFGVRPGQCAINGAAITFAGVTQQAVAANSATQVWLDQAGAVQTGSTLPADRTTMIPLAQITTDDDAITELVDLRSQTLLQSPTVTGLGLTAEVQDINQAIDGINDTVTAAALNRITGGLSSSGDLDHRHDTFVHDVNGEAGLTIYNDDPGSSAMATLTLGLRARMPYDLFLMPSLDHGFLTQRYNSHTLTPMCVSTVPWLKPGDMTTSVSEALMGVIPADGVVSDVLLSVADNIVSDQSSDGLEVKVRINGALVTSTHPAITDAAGTGFRCTAQSDGTAAQIVTNGDEQVTRGDLITVEIIRTAAGTITNQPSDVAVLVVIEASRPD